MSRLQNIVESALDQCQGANIKHMRKTVVNATILPEPLIADLVSENVSFAKVKTLHDESPATTHHEDLNHTFIKINLPDGIMLLAETHFSSLSISLKIKLKYAIWIRTASNCGINDWKVNALS